MELQADYGDHLRERPRQALVELAVLAEER